MQNVFTDQFSGSGKAIAPVCVCVCVLITYELDDL